MACLIYEPPGVDLDACTCQNYMYMQTCYSRYSYCNLGPIGLFIPDTILNSMTCFLYEPPGVSRGTCPCHN